METILWFVEMVGMIKKVWKDENSLGECALGIALRKL